MNSKPIEFKEFTSLVVIFYSILILVFSLFAKFCIGFPFLWGVVIYFLLFTPIIGITLLAGFLFYIPWMKYKSTM